MSYTDVTKADVLAAMAECDNRGRSAFLADYGFHPARGYELVHNGHRYDSKAIFGVAHKFTAGRPLTAGEFSGGLHAVVPHLRGLGFTVEAPPRPATFLMVHVPQGKPAQRNLEHGLETRTWGFPQVHEDFAGSSFDFVILATGAAPRVQAQDWFHSTATLYICQAVGGFYEAAAPHWPDEVEEKRVKYPLRFGIEPLAVLEDTPLGSTGPLPAHASDKIRLSGTDRGLGKLTSFDPTSLFVVAGLHDAVTLPTDPAAPVQVRVRDVPGVDEVPSRGTRRRGRQSGPGRVADPAKRMAIEQHAMKLAQEHYLAEGWEVEVLGKPYDLRCRRGEQERRVEVKGTTGAGSSVELTINEVDHARGYVSMDLFVVSDIVVERVGDGYQTSAGRIRLLSDWTPAEEHLRAVRFEYQVPAR
ncbi:protein NO VEIN domain-containing protein [Lentzea flaviverrucosa]|uniref:Uncharacterized protein n=1 Tax=Lentzea flaviverrucosa TaxID=200379 RepID=A0A1H9WSU8_9PSEU|nr:DUF3883 domain-containing protein [Lentzea flaviverrucosa]RDI23075.1 uncharacterized protein DUF3883 [Lentzea flaviverrucosa]SES37022.1 protein of unknown function [Lentzea flaviverrucosa]